MTEEDELSEVIEDLKRIAEVQTDPLQQALAKVCMHLALHIQEQRRQAPRKQQVVRAIAENLKTQRRIRQAIGTPRKGRSL